MISQIRTPNGNLNQKTACAVIIFIRSAGLKIVSDIAPSVLNVPNIASKEMETETAVLHNK